VNATELAPRLAEYRRRTPDARVLIRGDDKAKFGAAVDALDEVRKAGIRKVSVETVVGLTGR
jgi:biopolymer transport protein ExbD